MSDRCQQCGEVLNPDGQCACPKQKAASSLAAPTGSATDDVFFLANVDHTVDYVLDQASGQDDRQRFIAAVMNGLKPWLSDPPNAPGGVI